MMERDSVFEERVVWRGRSSWITMTGPHRAAFWTMLALSAIASAMAIAVASTLHAAVGSMIFFAAWCATLAMALRIVPQLWHLGAEYVVTDKHVVWKRGRFRRSIERAGITFARIHWYPRQGSIGDLELVRDVPTGALRRRLTITLRGVAHPDRVWDIIRGTERDSSPSSDSPMGQRLAVGERVIWSGQPLITWRRFLPRSPRDIGGTALALATVVVMGRAIGKAYLAARHVLDAGVPALSLGFLALVAGLAMTGVLLLGVAASLLWSTVLRPGLQARSTRYLITNLRVLIAQGHEELHLDRSRIVDVIEAEAEVGHDLFLILDGPRSRAVAVSGAFDAARAHGLLPVLRKIADADEAGRILKARDLPRLA